MFGSDYFNHLDYLKNSFHEMTEEYKEKKENEAPLITTLQSVYVKIFGIPEIGFRIRYQSFRKALSYISEKRFNRILDAGSGIGCYTLALARRYPDAAVVGIDISKKSVNIGKTMARDLSIKNVNFYTDDFSSKIKEEKFDFIVCVDVLEHIENYQKVLKNFHRLLNSGGLLYIHIPQNNQRRFFKKLRTWSHEGHVREGFMPRTFKKDLTKAGFARISVWNTFGFFGSMVWELNHLALSKSFVLTALVYPLLLPFTFLDRWVFNKHGLAAAYLYKKI